MKKRRALRCVWWLPGLALGGLLILQGLVEAKSIYIYVNEKGTSVITDTLAHVPTKYRKTVTVREFTEEPETKEVVASQSEDSDSNNPEGFVAKVLKQIPTNGINRQTLMLVGGGLVIVASFATLMFSRNMALKFAMKWVLMGGIVGTGYFWYFSTMGLGGFLGLEQIEKGEKGQKPILQRVKDETKEIEEIQKKKMMDIEKLFGGDLIPSEK